MQPFIITYYHGPEYSKADLVRRYQEVVDAGFNLACPFMYFFQPSAGESYERNIDILDTCGQLGIPYMVSDDRIALALLAADDEWQSYIDAVVRDYSHHPALYGYYVRDEPNAVEFHRLGEIVARFRQLDPEKVAYINLFPNYANAEQLGTATYAEHVNRYVDEVKPALISYDHYHFTGRDEANASQPHFTNERDKQIYLDAFKVHDRPGFFDNIEIVRAASIRSGIPFKVIILLVTHGPYRDLSEAELRWEVYQCLAYGTSGISYFTYWTYEPHEPWNYENGIITHTGEKTAHYEQVKRINAELAVVGDILINCRSEAVYHIGQEQDQVEYFTGSEQIKAIKGGIVTLGLFDQGYAVIANKDYVRATEIAVEVIDGVALSRIDKQTGQEQALSAVGNVYTIQLQAGDGELLRLNRS